MASKTNVLDGVGLLYIAPTGETLPELNNLPPPIVTVTPAGNWSAVGFTVESHKLVTEQEFEETYVLEHLGPITAPCVKERAVFMVKLAERDLAAFNQGMFSRATLASIAAAPDQTAQDTLGFGDKTTVTQKSLLYLDVSPEAGSRVLHMYICQAINNQEIVYALKHEGFDAAFLLLTDPGKNAGERIYKWYDITAAATS